MRPIIIIFLFVVLALSSSVEEQYLEIEYKVSAKSTTRVFQEKTLTIIYSPKFFEAEGKKLSIEFQLPRKHLSKMQLEVTQSGRTNKKRAWNITKLMYVRSSDFGLQAIFGAESIALSSKVKIEEVYPQTIYLKILYDQDYKTKKYLDKIPFIINQNLILSEDSYKSLQEADEMVKIILIPELFTSSLLISDKLVHMAGTYYEQFERYYLNSYNQAISNSDIIRFARQYKRNMRKSITLAVDIDNFDDIQGQKSYQQQLSEQEQYDYSHSYTENNYEKKIDIQASYIKDKALDFVYKCLSLIKKIIFFNQSAQYTFLFILSIFSAILNQILFYVFFWIIIRDLFAHFRDHIGISMTSLYLIIAWYFFGSFFGMAQSYAVDTGCLFIALWFFQSILKTQFQRLNNFPYFRFSKHSLDRNYRKNDNGLMFLNGFIILSLLAGYYYLFGQQIEKVKNYSGTVATFTVIHILMDQYLIFLLVINQYLINNHLKSVRHLTKGYMTVLVLLALSNNYQIFWNSEPLMILLKLKQEIAVMLLAYQCLKWGDLGEGSRSFFAKKESEEYIAQREAELKKIKQRS